MLRTIGLIAIFVLAPLSPSHVSAQSTQLDEEQTHTGLPTARTPGARITDELPVGTPSPGAGLTGEQATSGGESIIESVPIPFGRPGDTHLDLRPWAKTDSRNKAETALQHTCFRFGPLENLFQARAVELDAKERGFGASAFWTGQASSWAVFSAPQGKAQQAEAQKRLREMGIKDFVWLSKPPYAGRYSGGIFSTQDSARRQRDTLAPSGMRFFVVPRGAAIQHWVDVMAPTFNGQSLLNSISKRHAIQYKPCPPAQR